MQWVHKAVWTQGKGVASSRKQRSLFLSYKGHTLNFTRIPNWLALGKGVSSRGHTGRRANALVLLCMKRLIHLDTMLDRLKFYQAAIILCQPFCHLHLLPDLEEGRQLDFPNIA